MDPNLKFSDRDNRYANPLSQSGSALASRSLNRLEHHSPHHIGFHSNPHGQPHDSKVIIQSSLDSPYLSYPQDQYKPIHPQTLSTGLSMEPRITYSYPQENEPGRYEHFSHDTGHPSSRGRSSGRRISDADLDALKTKNFAVGHHKTHASENVLSGPPGTFLSSLPNSRSYGVGSNLQELIHGVNTEIPQEGFRTKRHEDRSFSPEAKRLINSPAADEYKQQIIKPDRLPNVHTEPLPERVLLQPPSHTFVEHTTKTKRHNVPALHNIGTPSIVRDNDNTREYMIQEPHVVKRTIYTIEEKHPSEVRSHRSPERSQRTVRSAHSPLDNFRHSLKNEGTKVNRVVVETLRDKEERDQFYDAEDLTPEKRFNLRQAPTYESQYQSRPEPEFIRDQPVLQESNYQSMSSYEAHTPQAIQKHHEHNLNKHLSLKQELEELRHDLADYVRTSNQLEGLSELRNRHKGGFTQPAPETPKEHHEHREHHHHHHHHHHEHEHHKHHHEVKSQHVEKRAVSPEKKVRHVQEEETFKAPVVDKKSRHIIVKGVIGLLVIVLCSILWVELFTDIDLDDYYTF